MACNATVNVELLNALTACEASKDKLHFSALELDALKDKQLQAKNKEVMELQRRHFRTMSELEAITDLYLAMVDKRNLRGALEHVAGLINPKLGVQAALSTSKKDDDFRGILQRIASQENLRMVDLERSLDGIYHSFSKDSHGSEEWVCIRKAKVTSANERAVLAALFEMHGVKYTVMDESGALLSPSPYAIAEELAGTAE